MCCVGKSTYHRIEPDFRKVKQGSSTALESNWTKIKSNIKPKMMSYYFLELASWKGSQSLDVIR